MNHTKEKCPETAATVQSTIGNYQIKNITKEAACKYLPDVRDSALRALDAVISMSKTHYCEGLAGKPYLNNFTYEGHIATFGKPPRDDGDIKPFIALYDLCDKMFRESWEKGRTDARADARKSIPMEVQL